ncbi:hypothetical protein JCM9279_002664 [Rhodotorula babjevae]
MDPPPPRASFAPSSSSSLAPSTSPSTARSKSRTRTAAPAGTSSTCFTAARPAQAPAAPPTPAGPSSSFAAAAALLAASPHYTTSLRSRHSLYGTEDRVVLDLGSSVWKVGFSGEPQPRACASVAREVARERGRGPAAASVGASIGARGGAAAEEAGAALWGLEKGEPSEVEWTVREERVKRLLRRLWFEDLMIDPKTRKVIVLENPLLRNRVKEMIARVLFDNLQIPSMSFACSPLLALMAAGTVTGLVVDVGHLETTVLPIFHSRPLFPLLTTTPRAGARLTRRLRSLLLAFASYAPPPSSVNSMTPPTIGRVPHELLTDELVEEIKTRLCFVGEPLPPPAPAAQRSARASTTVSGSAMSLDVDAPSSLAEPSDPDAALVRHLEARYAATAPGTTPVAFRVPSLSLPPVAGGVGRGWVQVPGWVRERAAEVLWEEGGVEDEGGFGEDEECGLAGVVLECLLKLPIDLRKPLASSILLVGGTASMPGFFPRFKASLLSQLERSHPPSPPPSPPLPSSSSNPPEDDPMRTSTSPSDLAPPALSPAPDPEAIAKHRRQRARDLRLHTLRHSPRWAPLAPLAPHLAILNHPSPSPSSTSASASASSSAPPLLASSLARAREGAAPAFAPALQAWIGGSLAGALKVGGVEVVREEWDAAGAGAGAARAGEEEVREEEWEEEERAARRRRGARLPDWTRLA